MSFINNFRTGLNDIESLPLGRLFYCRLTLTGSATFGKAKILQAVDNLVGHVNEAALLITRLLEIMNIQLMASLFIDNQCHCWDK